MKRFTNLIIIIGAIGLVIGVGLFLYYRIAKNTPIPSVFEGDQTATGGTNGSQETAPFGQEQKANQTQETQQTEDDGSVLGVFLDEPTRTYFPYSKTSVAVITTDGKIIKKENNQKAFLSATQIQNIIYSSFSFDGKKALVVFGDQENPQISIFDMEKKVWEAIAESGIKNVAWAPNSHKLAYIKNDNGQLFILTRDTDKPKEKPQIATKIWLEDITLTWQTPQLLILAEKPSGYTQTSIWAYDLQTKNLFTVQRNGQGLEVNANSTFDKYLSFSVNRITRKQGILSLVNNRTDAVKQLSFTTLPIKCSFELKQEQGDSATSTISKEIILCATPRNQDVLKKNILPDAYYKSTLMTIDDIVEIDPTSGEIIPILSNSDILFDAIQIKTKEDRLFFINRYDQKVYRGPQSSYDGE